MATVSSSEIDALVAGETVPRRFCHQFDAHGDRVGIRTRDGDDWTSWTWRQVAELTGQAAAGLQAAGVSAGDRVLMMMRNRPDFHWLDLAAQYLRATPVSIYNSSSPEEIQYLADHAEASVAIVEDAGFADRIATVREKLPRLQHVYVIETPGGDVPAGTRDAKELYEHGTVDLRELAEATEPDDLATLIYTSGTTGPPKGVMITQYNVVYTAEMLRRTMDFDGDPAGRRIVSYLPMAHIAERMVGHYLSALMSLDVHCCPDMGQLSQYLGEARPELFFGVPRVYEKIYHGVQSALSGDPERKEKFDEAVAAALEIKAAERAGTVTDEQRETWDFLDAVAFSTVRQLVGLDAMEMAITGAAPLPPSILEWYNAIGVPLSEIYGMSESSGPITWTPHANKPGYVGPAVNGCEVAIADDGEVLCRGGNIFPGYLKQPDKTAETLIDGWLHTGDIGELDDDGYLRIIDRKKELIITSGGKNISPANLEAELKLIPLIGQAAVIGDGRKFISAVLALDPEAAASWAATNDRDGTPLAELADDAEMLAEVQRGVDAVNARFANVEQIKRFVVVGEEWLPDSDLLTPTSKLKRRGVATRYSEQIEEMYR